MQKNKKQKVLLHSSRTNTSYDALVLDGENRQALATVRSLGKKGLRVAVLGNFQKNIPAFSSKYFAGKVSSPAEEGSEAYISFLLKFLKANKVKAIIPSSDGTIEILRKYRKLLKKLTSVALASDKALTIAVNKNKTLSVAQTLGIKIPKSITVVNTMQLEKAVDAMHFPLVLKPNESWTQDYTGSKRVCPILATTKQGAKEAFTELTQHGGEVLVQEYLTGKREAVSIIYVKKQVYAKFAQWAKRTQPLMGGTSVLRQSIQVPDDIGEQTEKLIRALDLEGYAEVEFRRDAAGVPYLMEINPRLSASLEVAIHADIDFPHLLYQWTIGEKIDKVLPYKKNVWARYLAGDIITLAEVFNENSTLSLKMHSLGDFLITFFQPMHYDYIDLKDMQPAWNAIWDFVVRNLKKLISLRVINPVADGVAPLQGSKSSRRTIPLKLAQTV